MNKRMVFSTLGKLTISEAALMTFPLIVAFVYGEFLSAIAYAIAIGIALTVGFALYFIFRTKNHTIYAKEGFILVALGWLVMSIIGG